VRSTRQWFLNLEHAGLRVNLLEAIEEDITWVPAAGRERIKAMVELRPDWCLSRQRYWGVPIPALICQGCKEEFLSAEVIEKLALLTAKEGTDSWFAHSIEDFLTAEVCCPHCGSRSFAQGSDILDVWFDSGVSHQAVLKKREELDFPCALYLEGSDQHRGWFQSSLIPAMCIDKRPPFKCVLTHGFVVDGEGRKMSKSLGNVISPFDIIKDYGADILRLWVASSDYNEDIRISPLILSRLAEAYRKIRNTARFILSNLYDFRPDSDRARYADLKTIDRWILFKLEELLSGINTAYDSFEFYKAHKDIYDFCNEELSMLYLDMVKGRLYTYGAGSPERRAAQTVIYEILNVLVRVMAPLLVFTADEIWQHMPKGARDSGVSSVHLLDWPQPNPEFSQQPLEPGQRIGAQLADLMGLIPEVARLLEEKRGAGEIGSSFDAQIIILTKDDFRYKYLESFKNELAEIFKVSQVEIKKAQGDFRIQVGRAEGKKCPRCWNYSTDVGRSSVNPLLCPRCLEVVERSN
jgi:isoleucyl-tRNA synthetase